MIEFLPVTISSTLDLSLVLGIVAIIAFFFGKLINEVSPYKENKYAIYTSGAFFVIIFVIFPPIVLYTVFESKFITFNYLIALGLHFILSWFLGKRLQMYRLIQRMKLEGFLTNLTLDKTKKVLEEHKFLKKLANIEQAESGLKSFYFKKLPQWLMLLFAILNYWFAIIVFSSGAKPILMFLSSLFIIINLSCLAVFYAYNNVKYPQVTAHLDDGEKIKGELAKIDEGFINIIGNNKVYHIIDSKVKYLEVEIITKQGEKQLKKKVLG